MSVFRKGLKYLWIFLWSLNTSGPLILRFVVVHVNEIEPCWHGIWWHFFVVVFCF